MKMSYSDLQRLQNDPRSYSWHRVGLQCDRQARHAFWYWRWRCWRRELVIYATILCALALAGLIVVWAGLKGAERVPQPQWNGERWECPATFTPYADQDEAMRGEPNYVHCVQ